MSIPVLTSEPISFIAGNTVKWTKSFSDFPASEWTLSYALVKDGKQITFNAVADGDDFSITITAIDSAGYDPGVYAYQATVAKGDDKHTFTPGKIEIKPGFAAQTTGYDARSDLEILRDEILALLTDKKDRSSYSISGRSLTSYSHDELWSFYNKLNAKIYAKERRAGRRPSNTVKVQFG